jgi:DNA topoisomerase III
VIWKQKAGKTLPPSIVKELMETRRTAKPVTGFRGRSGRSFSAKLELVQGEDGKWRVDFDEEWAKRPRPDPPPDQPNGPDGDRGPREHAASAAGE